MRVTTPAAQVRILKTCKFTVQVLTSFSTLRGNSTVAACGTPSTCWHCMTPFFSPSHKFTMNCDRQTAERGDVHSCSINFSVSSHSAQTRSRVSVGRAVCLIDSCRFSSPDQEYRLIEINLCAESRRLSSLTSNPIMTFQSAVSPPESSGRLWVPVGTNRLVSH